MDQILVMFFNRSLGHDAVKKRFFAKRTHGMDHVQMLQSLLFACVFFLPLVNGCLDSRKQLVSINRFQKIVNAAFFECSTDIFKVVITRNHDRFDRDRSVVQIVHQIQTSDICHQDIGD